MLLKRRRSDSDTHEKPSNVCRQRLSCQQGAVGPITPNYQPVDLFVFVGVQGHDLASTAVLPETSEDGCGKAFEGALPFVDPYLFVGIFHGAVVVGGIVKYKIGPLIAIEVDHLGRTECFVIAAACITPLCRRRINDLHPFDFSISKIL